MSEGGIKMELSDSVKVLLKEKSNGKSNAFRVIGVHMYGLHKGYFGISKDSTYYHPTPLIMTAHSYLGSGSVEFMWPGGSLLFSVPVNHLGMIYSERRRPKVNSIPHGTVWFWGQGKIQDSVERLHVVEYDRKDHQKNIPAQVMVSAWWYEDATFKNKIFLNETIKEYKYEKYFDVPPE